MVANEDRLHSMLTLLAPPTLERVLQGLYDSEIRCGIQNEPLAGRHHCMEGDILRDHRR